MIYKGKQLSIEGSTVDSACQSRNSTMKSKELSVELRDRIVWWSGEGYKTIYRVLKVHKSTVSSIIREWKEYGMTQIIPRAGCPTKVSKWARRTLVREVTKNPITTLTELQNSLAEMGEPAGRSTISAAIHKSRLYWRVTRRKPLLRKRHMTACLELVKRHVKDWEHEAKDSVGWWDGNWTLWMQNATSGRTRAQLMTHLIPSLPWSMVVVALCYGNAFHQQGLGYL